MPHRPIPLERVADLAPPDRGLTRLEVESRRARYGRNDVLHRPRHPWWSLLQDTARDPMLWFLIGTSALYASIGDHLESLVLAAATLPIAAMDAYLHRRTSASTESLQSRVAAHARVRRDGAVVDVAAADLVPGDLVLVAAGDLVPADGVLIAQRDLQVDESALSGESLPVRKRAVAWALLVGSAPSVGFEQWLFAGTRLLAGQGELRVVHTGSETLYGEIVRSVATGRWERTPAQRSIAVLVGTLTGIATAVCIVLAAVRLHQGFGWVDALVSAATLAVAALPEEFPIVFTFFLGVGVYRLARRHALVRRAAAVENIGRVTTICSDKTGTLTEGRLALATLVPADGIDEHRLLGFAAHAARAETGDPLDAAILQAAAGAGTMSGADASLRGGATRVALFAFTEDRKRETCVLRADPLGLVAVTKGAPETILQMTDEPDAGRAAWSARAAALAQQGHKVIACAWRILADAPAAHEPDGGFRIAGLLAFTDPVRPGVAAAVRDCRAAGIRTIMLTGDHPVTALAVARAIGLGGASPAVIAGDALAERLEDRSPGDLADIDVVARATPAVKLAVVRALQRTGEVVAVTGDGVNDVPALQTGDVGIAMGERGTQSARDVAAIVLLDDDFATIVAAIAEGRQLFQNLRESFRYLLTIHLPLVATAALIPLAGYPLLYLPIHIVWLELIIHPTALLAFQSPARPAALAPLEREPTVRLFTRSEWLGIAMVGVALTTIVAGGFLGALEEGSEVGHARAFALVTLCFASATLAALGSRLRTGAARIVTAMTVALSLVLVQTPVLANLLHVVPLHADDLAAAAFAALIVAGLLRLTTSAGARAPQWVQTDATGSFSGAASASTRPSSAAGSAPGSVDDVATDEASLIRDAVARRLER